MSKEDLKDLNKFLPRIDFGFSDFIRFKDLARVCDVVKLPIIELPETIIKGECEFGKNDLLFEKMKIQDTASVYKITRKHIWLIFNHALFPSPIDLNDERKFEKTQLYKYLNGVFSDAMKKAGKNGIPVEKISLLRESEIFGKKALPFFYYAKNRIAERTDESSSAPYWLKPANNEISFCYASGNLCSNRNNTSAHANVFVRPCFSVPRK